MLDPTRGMQRHCRSSLRLQLQKQQSNFIVGIYEDMIWNDMWGWYVGIWWDLMASYIVLLHALRKTKKCQKNVRFWVDLEGCNFIVPKTAFDQGLQFYRGVLSKRIPRGKGMQRHCRSSLSSFSCRNSSPQFYSGDMWWYDIKWYVMICGDLMGFERIWWLLTSCFYML